MSSCAASSCICSPRASFVSVTSASLPIADAPDCCRFASLHWAQFHRRSKQKPPPPRNHTLFGFALSAADRWWSSSDLPLLNSNSVLRHCCSLLPHETAGPQLETAARFTARRPRLLCSRPDPTARPLSHYFQPSILAPSGSSTSFSTSVPTPVNFKTYPSLHSISIRPASAAPAASF
jgi:hypothetical protein